MPLVRKQLWRKSLRSVSIHRNKKGEYIGTGFYPRDNMIIAETLDGSGEPYGSIWLETQYKGLSFEQLKEVLTDDNQIFIDWNHPTRWPTFDEIQERCIDFFL